MATSSFPASDSSSTLDHRKPLRVRPHHWSDPENIAAAVREVHAAYGLEPGDLYCSRTQWLAVGMGGAYRAVTRHGGSHLALARMYGYRIRPRSCGV